MAPAPVNSMAMEVTNSIFKGMFCKTDELGMAISWVAELMSVKVIFPPEEAERISMDIASFIGVSKVKVIAPPEEQGEAVLAFSPWIIKTAP